MINKALISPLLFVIGIVGCPVVLADNYTATLGYAQSKVQNFHNIRGVNFQYRYEWEPTWSLLLSFSYMTTKADHFENILSYIIESHTDMKYYSLLLGPAYRIAPWISFYAIAGIAHTKHYGFSQLFQQGKLVDPAHSSYSGNKNAFAYGAGVNIEPGENISLSIGYEGSKTEIDALPADRFAINGFIMGIGYRF